MSRVMAIDDRSDTKPYACMMKMVMVMVMVMVRVRVRVGCLSFKNGVRESWGFRSGR